MGQLGLQKKKRTRNEGEKEREKKEGKRAISAFLDALPFDRTPPSRFRSANRDVFYLEVGERSVVRSLLI